MFSASYETTGAAPYYRKEIANKLSVLKIEGFLNNNIFGGVPKLFALIEKNPRTNDVPNFSHPYKVNDNLTGPYWVIDLRPYFGKFTKDSEGKYVTPKEGPVQLMIKRGLLEIYWDQIGPSGLLKAGNDPIIVFTRWLSGLLKSRNNLDEATAQRVQAIVAYYYICLHIPESSYGPHTVETASIRINRALRIPLDKALEFITPLGYLGNIDDLAKALREHSGSYALHNVNIRYLYSLVVTSWYGGPEVRDMLYVAMEFPPAFVSMLLMAGTERLYKKTLITQTIEREKRSLNIDEFALVVNGLFNEIKS